MKIAYPNNATTEYEYLECCSRIGSIVTRNGSSQVIQSFEYEYDLAGNRTRTYLMDGSFVGYQYDDLNRLTAAGKKISGNFVWSRRYSYDRVGNIQQLIWSQGGGSGTLNYAYYPGTNLLKTALNKTYTYDQNGNPITCSDGRQFQYDFENRLTQLTNTGTQTDFTYNGFGDRVAKIYNVFHQEKEIEYQKSVDEILGLTRNYNDLPLSRSVTTHQYVYDDLGRQMYEKQTVDARQTLMYYTYGFGMEARRVNQTNQYLHSDILGSVTAITNSSGSAMGTYEYDPYGIMLSSSSNLGNFGFTGQEVDFDVNLYHFPARYYEPYWGRFLTPDPIKEKTYYDHLRATGAGGFASRNPNEVNINSPQKLNPYLYTENNPVSYLDITGLFTICQPLLSYTWPFWEDVGDAKYIGSDWWFLRAETPITGSADGEFGVLIKTLICWYREILFYEQSQAMYRHDVSICHRLCPPKTWFQDTNTSVDFRTVPRTKQGEVWTFERTLEPGEEVIPEIECENLLRKYLGGKQ